jgi:hypothetical protein
MDNKKKKPIQVYLDSADYSLFSNEEALAKQSKTKAALDFLKKCLDKKIIEVRTSSVVITEITHVDETHEKYGIARAKLVTELSRKKVFISPFDLFEKEALYLADNQEEKRSYAYNDENLWLTQDVVGFPKVLREQILKDSKKLLREANLTRQQRKLLEKTVFDKHGRIKEHHIKNLLKSHSTDGVQNLNQDNFLSELIPFDELVKLISKHENNEKASRNFFSLLCDPEVLVSKVVSQKPELREGMVNAIRGHGAHFSKIMQSSINTISDVKLEAFDRGMTEEQYLKHIKPKLPKLLRESMLGARKKILSRKEENFSNRTIWDEKVKNSEFGSIPALDTVLSLMERYLLDRILNEKLKLSLSDGPDMLHAAYAPYSDVFRGDKRTIDLFRKTSRVNNLKNTELVAKIDDIVVAIEKVATRQGVTIG